MTRFKMSLANVQGKLSRNEMKRISGGTEEPVEGIDTCKDQCTTVRDCPSDRTCGGGECGGITIKRCNPYPG